MPLILPGNVATATASTTFDVANSCRFDDGDSPSMSKTPGASSNRRTFTFSAWVKRSTLGSGVNVIFSASNSANRDFIYFEGDALKVHKYNSGYEYKITTNRLFRDVSAWYHIVAAFDTTQGTASNRIKLYVNGVQETSLADSDYPSEDFDTNYNTVSLPQTIGKDHDASNYFDGYIAEVVMIDGSALAPTSFGEFNSDSPTIWQPIDVSGLTFGTNGYYLDFEASANLGNDANGGTDFSESNIAAINQCVDTCTNNFATMNPLVKGNTALTFSQGNLKLTSGGGWGHAVGSIGVAHGKWYWEVDEINASNNAFFGICNEFNLGHLDGDSTPYSENGLMLYFYDGRRTIDGTDSEGEYNAWGTTHGFALDLDSDPRTIKFYKDNSLEATENLTANFPAGEFVFPIFMGSASSNPAIVEFNFGNPVTALASGNNDANGYGSFEFSPPSGYIAICTKNLGSDGG